MNKKYCITFDVDWAPDFIIRDLLEILGPYNFKATFFMTHKTDVLGLRNNIEKGIHPVLENINQAEEKIRELKELYPEAISLRAHSLCDSGRLNRIFSKYGIKIKSNYMLYMQPNIRVLKTPYAFELYEAPIYMIDGNRIIAHGGEGAFSVDKLDIDSPGLKIFSFHPVHIYLNTEDYARYEKAKAHMNDKNKFDSYVNKGLPGARDLFTQLLNHIRTNGHETYLLRELVYEQ